MVQKVEKGWEGDKQHINFENSMTPLLLLNLHVSGSHESGEDSGNLSGLGFRISG